MDLQMHNEDARVYQRASTKSTMENSDPSMNVASDHDASNRGMSESSAMSPKLATISDSAKAALNLTFPRCSICQTGWFDAIEEETSSNKKVDAMENSRDDGNPSAYEPQSNANDITRNVQSPNSSNHQSKRKRGNRPSVLNLFPMPSCQCSTRLAVPPLPTHLCANINDSQEKQNASNDISVTNNGTLKSLSKISIHTFKNLAICRTCLEKRISVANEVQEHDYRDNRPNGQRNVHFTVEPKCVQCQQKFMARVLLRLLEGGREGDGANARGANGGTDKKRGRGSAKSVDWWDALEATIQLVGWAKRERRRGRRKIRREMKKMGKYQNSDDDEHLREEKEWWEEHGCCGRDGEGSSEDCYSDSCSDEEDWLQYSQHRKSPGQIRAAPGEILNELLQKDPKLRMEKEDEVFAKQFLQQEEEEKRKEEEKDRELALKLQGDPEEKSKEEEKDHELALKLQEAQKKTPIKTRSKSYPEGVTHSVLDSFKRTPLTGAPATTAALSELCRDRSLAIASDNTARKSPKGKKDVVAIDLTINDVEDEDQNTPTHANHSNKQYAVLQNAGDMTKNIFGQNDQSDGDEEVNSNNQNRAGSSSDHSKVATASAHEQSSVEYPLVTPPTDRSTVPQSFHLSKNPKHNSTTNKRKPEPNITSPFMSGSTKKLREPKHHESISAKEPEIRVNDKSVSEIMNMGFREEDAKRCLRDADGDIQLAVSMLLSDASES